MTKQQQQSPDTASSSVRDPQAPVSHEAFTVTELMQGDLTPPEEKQTKPLSSLSPPSPGWWPR